jgi:hypothetical protein
MAKQSKNTKQTATAVPREEIPWTALDDAAMDRVMARNRAAGIKWPSDILRREAAAAAKAAASSPAPTAPTTTTP